MESPFAKIKLHEHFKNELFCQRNICFMVKIIEDQLY